MRPRENKIISTPLFHILMEYSMTDRNDRIACDFCSVVTFSIHFHPRKPIEKGSRKSRNQWYTYVIIIIIVRANHEIKIAVVTGTELGLDSGPGNSIQRGF